MKNAVLGSACVEQFHACDQLTHSVKAVAEGIWAWFKSFIPFFVGIKTIDCLDVLRRNEFGIEKRNCAKGFAVLIQNKLRVWSCRR